MVSLEPRPFVKTSFKMQAPLPHVFLSLFLMFIWNVAFSEYFFIIFVPFSLSLCMESASYVFSYRMVFFHLVTTGWIFDISLLCENSINQSINQGTFFVLK